MPDDNHKTPEQLKREAFAKNPDEFLAISEIICCVVRNPKSALGISAFIGEAKRSELNMAQGELNHVIAKARIKMDVESQMRHDKILKPGGNNPKFGNIFRR